jgi:DNA processing protein
MVKGMDDPWAWVALTLVPGVGWDAERHRALRAVAAPARLFATPRRTLAAAIGPELAAAVSTFDADGEARRQRGAAERCGARLVTLEDPEYPASLRPIPAPPPFLLVRGALAREDGLAVAVVGSRRATAYGLRTAERLAADLAGRGVTVVSGLARGVDTAAHKGARAGGGRTLAVLGSGVDVIYPPENRRLAEEILRGGAIVSQFPMGTPPLPQHFPIRNRVIAALTLGTVVVEAAERSGALITARCAGELGREVYAVPGNVSSAASQGANRLIQDGAKLVRDWEDVVAEWPEAWRRAVRPLAPAPSRPGEGGPAPASERRLLSMLGDDPIAIDGLIEESRLPAGEVAASLATLELRGLVRRLPGQRYVRG